MANKNTKQARRAGFASKDDENRGNKNPFAKGHHAPRNRGRKQYPLITMEQRHKAGV